MQKTENFEESWEKRFLENNVINILSEFLLKKFLILPKKPVVLTWWLQVD